MEEFAALTTEADKIEAIGERARAWGRKVADRLDHERPGWKATFLEDSGITQHMSRTAGAIW